MPYFIGNTGAVRLRRGSDDILTTISGSIVPDDVNLSLNRVGVEASIDNLLTGDKVDIETADSRGLAFIPASNWSSNVIEDTFSCFVNVNAAGGLRLYPDFEAAVNNQRGNEIALQSFTGDPINISIRIRDINYNFLGHVTNYEFNATRENIDITSLSDKFRKQYEAGLLSGSGRIDANFDPKTTHVAESSLLMLQLIQRIQVGAACDMALFLTDKIRDTNEDSIFYRLTAVITSAGVTVGVGDVITCTLDFVTTGEVRLLVGQVSDFLLKEDDDRIQKQQDLDFLLVEVTD